MNAKNVFGAVTVAIALFFLWPAVFGSWSEMNALKAALAERTQILADREAILADASKEYTTLQDIMKGSTATTFTSLIPVQKDTAELISAASAIATNSGLQLTTISINEPEKPKKDEAYYSMRISMELAGEYSGVRSFLRDFESYVRVLNVKSLSLSQDDQAGMRIEMEAETYFIK